MVHKKIRIRFEVAGRCYEAVGFLNEGEASVDGDEMFRRVPDAIGKEDEAFLWKRRNKLPKELQCYYLATNRRDPHGPRNVSRFNFSGRWWHRYWHWLDTQWHDDDLVLRRCE